VSDKLDRPDLTVAWIASRQHGVITSAQLKRAGLSRETVRRWTKRGRLHRLYRGVYAVGHAAPSEARSFMAAVLACGNGAALSHVSATVLWGFLKAAGRSDPRHLTQHERENLKAWPGAA